MLGLRHLVAEVKHFFNDTKLGKAIEHVTFDLLARPGWKEFAAKYKEAAGKIVADLLNPASNVPVQDIFVSGVSTLKQMVTQDATAHHDNWLHQLVSFAYEEAVAIGKSNVPGAVGSSE